LLIAMAMIAVMLIRPRGLWPTPEHGRVAVDPQAGRRSGGVPGQGDAGAAR